MRPTEEQLLAMCDFVQELRAILTTRNSAAPLVPGHMIGALPSTWLRAYAAGKTVAQTAELLRNDHAAIVDQVFLDLGVVRRN